MFQSKDEDVYEIVVTLGRRLLDCLHCVWLAHYFPPPRAGPEMAIRLAAAPRVITDYAWSKDRPVNLPHRLYAGMVGGYSTRAYLAIV